jgi:inner membrane protein
MFAGRVHGAETPRQSLVVIASFGALAMLPDADVIGVMLGLPDVGPLGHRGLTHSLLFAVAVALGAALLARRLGWRPLYTAFFAFLVVGSHGPLDALTHNSRGVPLLWPISDQAIAMPWRPIPVAPTGMEFVSARGFEIALVEFIYFLPLFLASLWPGRARWRATFNRAVTGGLALTLAVAACLVVAEVILRDSRLVSRLEAPMLHEIALKREQHLRRAQP